MQQNVCEPRQNVVLVVSANSVIVQHAPHAKPNAKDLAALTLGAIGIVYGDIGTSPLYALKEVFNHGHLPLTPENIYGILSMMFWTLTVIV